MSKPSVRVRNWVGGLVVCIMGFFLLRHFEHNQVYHPERRMECTGADLGHPCEDVWFAARDGVQLNGWFFAAQTNSPRRHLAIMLCHGNAGNISHRLETCDALLATGANVFVFDYRGYGLSRGRPSEEGTYLDAQAAHQWLRQKGFAGPEIIAFGESLGGGVATELARRESLGGLVLQSTFTSIPDIGAELFPWLPVRRFSTIRYDTRAKLPRLNVPVLVMHSRADDLIGFHHSQTNFAAANEPKLFWEISGGHNDPLFDRQRFVEGLERFMQKLEKRAPVSQEERAG